MVVLIRLIELSRIKLALPIEINNVPEVVAEGRGRLLGSGRIGNLLVHRVGDRLLDIVSVDAAGVSHCMKDQDTAVCSGFCLLREDHVQRKGQIGEICQGRRDEPRMRLGR